MTEGKADGRPDGRSDKARRLELGRQRRAKTRAKVIAAAFKLFGEKEGLYARIEDVSQGADITRAMFYDHFSGMAELREAVSYEVTDDFPSAVSRTIALLDNARERIAVAIRFYLHRVREVPGWGRAMINLSANGVISAQRPSATQRGPSRKPWQRVRFRLQTARRAGTPFWARRWPHLPRSCVKRRVRDCLRSQPGIAEPVHARQPLTKPEKPSNSPLPARRGA